MAANSYSPIITTSLYFIIFGEILFKNKFVSIGGQNIAYDQYLVPGLIAMAIIMNSYSSTSSSFFSMKFQKNIDELLLSPLPHLDYYHWIYVWWHF